MSDNDALLFKSIDPQQQQQPLPVGQGHSSQPPTMRYTPPTTEGIQRASQFVDTVKDDCIQRLKRLQLVEVPDHERPDYNTVFEHLYRHVIDMDTKMHLYASFMKEDSVRKFLAVIVVTYKQHAMLSSPASPKYILDLKTIHSMNEQVGLVERTLQSYVLNTAGSDPPEVAHEEEFIRSFATMAIETIDDMPSIETAIGMPSGSGQASATHVAPQQQPPQNPTGLSLAEGADDQRPIRKTRPSPEEVQKAIQFVSMVKAEYSQRTKTLKFVDVPESERLDYNKAFEYLYRHVIDMDTKMHIYASFMKEEGVRKLLAVLATSHHQRALLSSATPKYILDLKTVLSMTEQLQIAQSGLQSYVLGLSIR